MRIRKWFVLLILVNMVKVQAQTIIQGHITDLKLKSIAGASVTIRNITTNAILGYNFSDQLGNYKLSYKSDIDSLSISVSGFNIAAASKRIINKAQVVNFAITEKEIAIKEVIVKSTKIWGKKDTINYLVSAFSDKKDFVIGDVLKKMPGITVGEDGSISWQGRAINKFYVENLDLLQGRYGIATNNISAKDVATVQVLENHQPIKALEKTEMSNDAAINIKLKDEAKGTLSIMARLGLGASPLLWEDELAGLYFAKEKQNITTYKTNNSGQNLANELTSFSNSTNISGENMLSIQMPSPPGIDQKRYLFNNSNALTFNNLFKTKENSQLNLNLIYLNDHENRESSEQSIYYLPGQKPLILDEGMTSANNTDRLETEIRYNVDDKDKYINNYVNIQGLWNRSIGDVITSQNVHQILLNPSFSILNAFNWIKKTGDYTGFKLLSTIGFKTAPQELMIYPGLYPDLFNSGNDYSMLKQQTQLNSYYSNNNFTLLSPISFGNFHIDSDVGLNLEYRKLNSNLYTQNNGDQPMLVSADSMKNDLDWMKYSANVSATLKYSVDALNIDIGLPLNYNILMLDNKIKADKENIYKLYFQPSIHIMYDVNDRIKINGEYRFNHQMGDIMSLYTGNILINYRSLNRYDGRLFESSGNGGSVNLSYKDLINMLFFSSGMSYNYSRNNILYGQSFQGILSVISSMNQGSPQNSISFSEYFSKGFDWKNIVTKLNASYGISSSAQLQQNKLIDYSNEGLSVSGSVDCRPASFLVFAYKGTWGKNWNKIESGDNNSSFTSFVNDLSLDINLPESLSLNIGFEHYYNSASPGNKNLSFTDLGLTYIFKNTHYSLCWNNIFNADNYTTSYFDGINSFQNIYHIRPGNIMLKTSIKLK